MSEAESLVDRLGRKPPSVRCNVSKARRRRVDEPLKDKLRRAEPRDGEEK